MNKRIQLDKLRESVSAEVAALNPGLFGSAPVEAKAFYSKPTKGDRKHERELQAECERWLSLNGYFRLTPSAVARPSRPSSCGFFGHWFESQRNAFMPDLFICDSTMRRCLMVELKVCSRYQPGQKEFIDAGLWIEVRTTDEFIAAIKNWESPSSK